MKENIKQTIIKHLINPRYEVESRRSQSVISPKFRHLLDPYFDASYSYKTYPMNSIGAFIRINKRDIFKHLSLELLHKAVTEADPIIKKQTEALSREQLLNLYREVFVALAQKDYEIEWNEEKTRTNYDIDLTKMTSAYNKGNVRITNAAKAYVADIFQNGKSCTNLNILDIGVGSGNTIVPLVNGIAPFVENVDAKITIYLYDTDIVKTEVLRDKLAEAFNKNNFSFVSLGGDLLHLEQKIDQLKCKLDLIVSGATFCHSTDKGALFKQLKSILNENGRLYFWDAIFPWTAESKLIISDVIMAKRYAGFIGNVYPAQLGYREGVKVTDMISGKDKVLTFEDEFSLCKQAYDYTYLKLIGNGFNFGEYFNFLQQNCFKNIDIPCEHRSKYQLIEAFEDLDRHIEYFKEAGLTLQGHEWLGDPEPISHSNFRDAANWACVYFELTNNKVFDLYHAR